MFGRGAADMKSGFAVGMLALRAVRDVAPDLFARRRLGFVAVVEEECTGNGTLRSIAEDGVIADEVIVLEPTNLGLLLGGVGVLWVEIDVAAPAGHAYDADTHESAIDIGMRIVGRLRRWAEDLAVVRAGAGARRRTSRPTASISERSRPATGSRACRPARRLASASASRAAGRRTRRKQAVRGVVAEFAARIGAAHSAARHARPASGRAAIFSTATSRLARDLAAAHRQEHRTDPAVFMLPSTTDARTYLNDFGVPALCFGAVAHDMHGIDESVELQSIVDAARTLARFLLNRFGEAPA